MRSYGEMILHAASCIENRKQKICINTIKASLMWNEEKAAELEREIADLVEKGYLQKAGSSFVLTDMGHEEADRISKAMVRDEFSRKIDRFTRSAAYLDFCEEVYGYRTYLFNMMDKQQIDFVLNNISISSGDTVLDLGCGSGSILSLLAAKYGCRGIGIDQLDADIIERNSKAIKYINGDIDRISEYNIRPTVVLSIDSLYFSKNMDRLVQQLDHMGSSRSYLFYSQYIFDEASADKSILRGNNTKIADVLNKNGICYKTVDYSENEHLLYERSLKALEKYKKQFENEGNADLYEQKLKEDSLGLELYNKGLAKRYLYIIENVCQKKHNLY